MDTDTLERELGNDLLDVHDRFADDKFCAALYRSITRTKLSKRSVAEGHVTLTFSQAEGLINELRGRLGQGDLTLAQTGGEGEVDRTAAHELESRGWTFAPAATGSHDPGHDASAASPPPERADGGRWAQEAHAEAAAERARRPRVPGS